MPSIKLTEKAVDRLQLSDTAIEYYDTKLAGFGVRTGKKNKVYFVKPTSNGKRFNRRIGTVGLISFDDAYQAAIEILKDAEQGVTPDDREKQNQSDGAITLETVLKDYLTTRKKLKDSTRELYKKSLEWYVPDWLDYPMKDITPSMVVAKHAEVGKTSKAMSDGTFKVIRALFSYAMEVHEDVITRNPVKRLSTLSAWYRVPRKKSFIRPTQLPEFFQALKKHPGVVADYLELMLYTGIRSKSEIATLTISDIDIKDRSITLDIKNMDKFTVPVGKVAMAILQRRIKDAKKNDTVFLFYSQIGDAEITKHVKDTRKSVKRIFMNTSLADITPHDLRRTYLTYADELEIPNVVQKRLVGHSLPTDITDGYKVLTNERLRAAIEKIETFIRVNSQQKKRA